MNTHQWFHIKVLVKRLAILLILYAICRILFFQFNKDLFPDLSLISFMGVMWYGLRFDIASIALINSLFILMHVIPNPWRETFKYQQILKLIFYAFNGVALMMESGDFIYFRYGLKRTSTHELGLTNDMEVIPMVIRDFWFIFILVLILTLLVELLYRRTEFIKKRSPLTFKPSIHYPTQLAIMVVFLIMTVIGARGGIQPQPLSPSLASKAVKNEQLSELVINTPFSVIYALGHRKLEMPSYFEQDDLDSIFSPYHSQVDFYSDTSKPNICVIVLESFSKEYIGYYNGGKGYTPYLDSLLGEGKVFSNFYANGKSSNQGIIAITSGIPVLMEEPFISSLYKDNAFIGIGSLLRQKGYYSAFYHGANNGSMGFDQFTQRAGFNAYYGRDEFANDEYFDGNWGIFDEPFLKYTAQSISELPQPFYAQAFTISAHHPYTLPEAYKGKFPNGSIPMLEVIGYSDYALRGFFEEASKQPWYDNTLFILTADHTGPPAPESKFYKNQVGAHSIWMLMYAPDGSFSGVDKRVAQQTDIFATVLDYADYDNSYFAFGHSLFDTSYTGMAFGMHAGNYMFIENDTALLFNQSTTPAVYHISNDSLLAKNLYLEDRPSMSFMENQLKAIIQAHHYAMINNYLTPR